MVLSSVCRLLFTDFRRSGLVLMHLFAGADSRTTTGPIIANRVTDKLTMVHDFVWCCRSGSAADTQAIADIVSRHLNLQAVHHGTPTTTGQSASIFSEICYANKDMLS